MANKIRSSQELNGELSGLLAKNLVIFIGVGIVTGLVFGIYLLDVKNTSQLVFVEGSSISIVTERHDFKQDEKVKIKIVNSGTEQLIFNDASYDLKITGLSGILMYSHFAAQTVSKLEPGDEIEFLWDQIKNDGASALEGLYKISAKGEDAQGNKVEGSTTITIWK